MKITKNELIKRINAKKDNELEACEHVTGSALPKLTKLIKDTLSKNAYLTIVIIKNN